MYAKISPAGDIESTFTQPQPCVRGVVQIADDDPRLEKFRLGNSVQTTITAAYKACYALRLSIIPDELFEILMHAANTANPSPELAPYTQRAKVVVGAEVDIALAYAAFLATVQPLVKGVGSKATQQVQAAVAKLQATMNAIADTAGVAHITTHGQVL